MINILDTQEEVSLKAAELFIKAASDSIDSKGSFIVALSGGSTPKRVFEILAQPEYSSKVDWEKVHVFWGDERCVPYGDPDSNARMAHEALLNHVPVKAGHVHIIKGDIPPHDAALQYEQVIKTYFPGEEANFDLIFLGMGDDGHTASLFPYTPVLEEKAHWVKEVYITKLEKFRVTFTQTLINSASNIAFLVAGANKAEVLNEVLFGEYQPHKYPSQLVKPVSGELIWLIDKAAAKEIAEKV